MPVAGGVVERQVEDVRADRERSSLPDRGVQLGSLHCGRDTMQIPGGHQQLIGDLEHAADGLDLHVRDQVGQFLHGRQGARGVDPERVQQHLLV